MTQDEAGCGGNSKQQQRRKILEEDREKIVTVNKRTRMNVSEQFLFAFLRGAC